MATMNPRMPAEVLEQSARVAGPGPDRRLSIIVSTPAWMEAIKVQAMEQPKTWRLVCEGGGSENEEVVFSVQGSILRKDLPPFLGKPPSARSKIKYLRQSITLSGLGTPTFRDAVRSTAEIFGVFDRQFNEGFLQPWVATADQGAGDDLLEASNRYLTPQRDASAAITIEFDQGVDPRGTLQAMAGSDHVHTDDNVVLYYKRRTEDDGRYSYQKIGPQSFRIGDIVEIQVSFVVVPLRGEKYKMISVLRSVAFIDGNFKQVKAKPAVPAPTALKRRVVYDDVEVGEGSRTRTRMDVDSMLEQ